MPDRQYHHGDLRNELLAATRAVVEADGSDAVTLAGISKACGVSVAAPYRHFPDKRALLAAVAGEGFAELGAALAAVTGSAGDARERLVAAGIAYVEYAVAHPHLFGLMFDARLRAPQSEAGPASLALLRELVEPVTAAPVDTAVRAVWALAHGLASLRIGGMLTFTRDDSETRLRDELAILLAGLDARPDAGS